MVWLLDAKRASVQKIIGSISSIKCCALKCGKMSEIEEKANGNGNFSRMHKL